MGFGPVLIIGAGSTGLAIAQGLRKLNIAFHIFETKDELASNPDDWSANISRSFPKLEQLLPQGAVDQLKTSTAVRASPYCGNQSNSGIRVFDGSSAELIRDNEVDKESLTSSKSKLKALCQEGIDVKVSQRWDLVLMDVFCYVQPLTVTLVSAHSSHHRIHR